ncbi:hypothetical protein M231_02718 [Tremella mesenterica]|uniref:Uncharacterized protein n=2 Tax=Tremella mesenterica TaxID=5217 RepID=A0A4Q1BQ79_TREME|nr:hypothetical protein M231_02718 [Tremella mesenterica]
MAAPFALCIALDLIAYGIARTLHLSMLPRRVPRSPPNLDRMLASEHVLLNDMGTPTLGDISESDDGSPPLDDVKPPPCTRSSSHKINDVDDNHLRTPRSQRHP